MKKNALIAGMILMVSFLISGCGSTPQASPTVAPTAVPTATSLPTLTSTPRPTETPTPTPVPPTQTPLPSPIPPTETPAEPELTMPTGKPAAEWQGIPVMPNAIAGDGDSQGYSFTIKATPDEIQAFYEKEMKKLGWDMFATGQGSTDVKMLMFQKSSGLVVVSVIPQTDGMVYVLIVK